MGSMITAIITNYKTRDLTETAVRTFRQFYPDVPLLVIDNGSGDSSTDMIKSLSGVDILCFEKNRGHGMALHAGIGTVMTPFVFTLDSDCEVIKGGFLEPMLGMLIEQSAYAIGWLRHVDKWNGVPAAHPPQPPPTNTTIPYIHPAHALYSLRVYHSLPQFSHSGAPCTENMREAYSQGFKVLPFPISDYIKHLGSGTRRMWGGDWNPGDAPPKRVWNPKDSFPI